MENSVDLKTIFYVLNAVPAMMLFVISNKFYSLSKSNKQIKNMSQGLFLAVVGGGIIFMLEIIECMVGLPYLEMHILFACIAIVAFYQLFKAVQ